MTLPALVLVHGGAHAADCWDLTVDEIHKQAPELDVLAVDLPGRRGKPGDLTTLTIADGVDSVISDIEEAGLGDIVIVGHSMGGLTVPGVVTKLGSSKVHEVVFAAAFVPPEGTAIVDTLAGPLARSARRATAPFRSSRSARASKRSAVCRLSYRSIRATRSWSASRSGWRGSLSNAAGCTHSTDDRRRLVQALVPFMIRV